MSFVLFNINSTAKVMQTYDMGKENRKFSPDGPPGNAPLPYGRGKDLLPDIVKDPTTTGLAFRAFFAITDTAFSHFARQMQGFLRQIATNNALEGGKRRGVSRKSSTFATELHKHLL